MSCTRCGAATERSDVRCTQCGADLAVGTLEVVRGQVPDRSFPLSPRTYTVGRARQNDICLPEPSVSKYHARLVHEGGLFAVAVLRLRVARRRGEPAALTKSQGISRSVARRAL